MNSTAYCPTSELLNCNNTLEAYTLVFTSVNVLCITYPIVVEHLVQYWVNTFFYITIVVNLQQATIELPQQSSSLYG